MEEKREIILVPFRRMDRFSAGRILYALLTELTRRGRFAFPVPGSSTTSPWASLPA